MGYRPNQVKMLQDRRRKSSSKSYEYYKNSTRNKGYGDGNNIKSVEVTESMLYSIRKRVKRHYKIRNIKIVVFTLISLILIIALLMYIA